VREQNAPRLVFVKGCWYGPEMRPEMIWRSATTFTALRMLVITAVWVVVLILLFELLWH
jgi:hypothetical protein